MCIYYTYFTVDGGKSVAEINVQHLCSSLVDETHEVTNTVSWQRRNL